MRKLLLLAAVAGILGTGAASAQIPQSLSKQGSSHLDSLRRVLELSPDLRLDWMTSQNGVDTLRVIDDFNRESIGRNWGLDPGYWHIQDGELDLTEDAGRSWRYLAVFLPVHNTSTRHIYSVSHRWGKNADAVGIREGAMALMVDAPSSEGSGYWLWHRWDQLWLWIVKNGTWEYTPGEGKDVDRQYGFQTPVVAGDVVTAYIRNQREAVYFDYYINDNFDATAKDFTKEFPKSDSWYVGVFMHGEELNNQIDDFTITWLEGDVVAPASVIDLRAIDSTASGVRLEWTSTGDNGLYGHASRLELRYSKSRINLGNFAKATLAPDLPAPAAADEKQQFTVTGLDNSTTYYFALKIFDEAGNPSSLSNLARAQTKNESTPKRLTVVNGCGQTGEVGKALPQPLIAKVTDSNGLGVSNSLVQFVVISGNGTVGGQNNLTMSTDANGEAKATWVLGTVAGTQSVEFRANGLDGSPHTCTATATASTPVNVIVVSGSRQVVPIGKLAPQPLMVRLVDQLGNGVVNDSMVFTITAGGGSILDDQVSAVKIFQTLTDSSGFAQARVVASNVYGDTTKILLKWTSSNGTLMLGPYFFVVAAWPDSVIAVKGNNQTADRGTALPESLVVQVLDAVNLPVRNYPVTFRMLSGDGTLANGLAQVDVVTDSSGEAKTKWALGHAAGEQQVEVTALFQGKRLRNTPLVFKATATIPTAVKEEATTLPQQFALHQNFPNPFNPETTISFDLPEAGQVEMNVYDVNGRRVRQLLATQMPAGTHRALWNSQDDNGHAVNSGIYFLVLRARVGHASGEIVATRKIILMK